MNSVRKGLRAGDLAKDNYGRLRCTACEQELAVDKDASDVHDVRSCPECDSEWKELG
jgi:predicted RNA-binding Zn-ribbon protein involved in translation (DUF1610 family)